VKLSLKFNASYRNDKFIKNRSQIKKKIYTGLLTNFFVVKLKKIKLKKKKPNIIIIIIKNPE